MTWLGADVDADARYRALDALEPGPSSVAALLSALRDASWRVRRLAAERLAALEGTPEVVSALIGLLGERDDAGARNAAASVLAQLGGVSMPAVISLLQQGDADHRKFAADILGEQGRSDAVAPLVKALGDRDANVRTAAAEALGRIGGPDARRALETLLASSDVMLRVCALEGLAALGAPPPLPKLTPLLADALTRRSAWRLLGHVRHPTATLLTVRALAVRESRDAALVSLGASGVTLGAEQEAELRAVLRPVFDLRTWLERGLASNEVERHLGALLVVRALGDAVLSIPVVEAVRDARDAELALDTLVRIGTPAARVLLSSAESLADLSGEARAVVADAIVRLAEPSLVPSLVALVDSGDPELAELGARALGRTRSIEAIAPLVRLFEDDALAVHAYRSLVSLAHSWPDEVRAALTPLVQGVLRPHEVRAWAEIVGAAGLDVVRRALHDADPALRASAAEASVHMPLETLGVLQAALMDEAPMVRRAAVRASSHMRAADLDGVLQRALADADASVLALACTAAGEAGAHAAAPRLQALCRHTDASVVLAALEALAWLGRLSDELLLRAAQHGNADVQKLAFSLGADRPLLLDKATAALTHVRWDVRVAAARLLSVAAGREAHGPLLDAVAREEDAVARALLAEAADALARRV